MDLGKKIGPLPLGAWLVVVAGGLGIAWYSSRNSEPTEPMEDGSGIPGVGDGSVGGGKWTPTDPGDDDDDIPDDPGPSDDVTNNDQWYTYIANTLIRLKYDPVLVDSALVKYLGGHQSKLSISEWVIIRAALSIMTPPHPIPPDPDDLNPPPPTPTPPPPPPPPKNVNTPTKPPPKPKPPPKAPKKPKVRYYTVRRGDNLWNISKKYYGSGYKYSVIFNANRKGKRRADGTWGMIRNPNLIYPNWKLIIP